MLTETRNRDYGLWHDIDASKHKHKGHGDIQSETNSHDKTLSAENLPNRFDRALQKHQGPGRSGLEVSLTSEPTLTSDSKHKNPNSQHKPEMHARDDTMTVLEDPYSTLQSPSDSYESLPFKRKHAEDIPFDTLSLQVPNEGPNHLPKGRRNSQDHRNESEKRVRRR